MVARYRASLVRVDQQLNDFMALLQESQLLNHAIVVLLSDHGEAFKEHGWMLHQGANRWSLGKQAVHALRAETLKVVATKELPLEIGLKLSPDAGELVSTDQLGKHDVAVPP